MRLKQSCINCTKLLTRASNSTIRKTKGSRTSTRRWRQLEELGPLSFRQLQRRRLEAVKTADHPLANSVDLQISASNRAHVSNVFLDSHPPRLPLLFPVLPSESTPAFMMRRGDSYWKEFEGVVPTSGKVHPSGGVWQVWQVTARNLCPPIFVRIFI